MISWAQRWRLQATRWVAGGADLLFPPGCRWCGSEDTPSAGSLCPACAGDFTRDQVRCPGCGAPATAAAGCPTCRRGRPAWDGIVILGAYTDDLREAVLRLKRPGSEDLAHALAALLVNKHAEVLRQARVDVVVPVPMHWWRRMRRGTSAAEEIARAVARALRVKTAPALVRTRATPMQNELSPAERPANVAGAFAVRGSVSGRHVLVVDDVVTTGATLASCCQALRVAGVAGVRAAALARADRAIESADRGVLA